MAEESSPPDLNVVEEWDRAVESRTVKDRVYEVTTTLTAPTSVMDIAERADCTKEGARPHLEWFVDLGILEKVADNPALFVRNEAYFEFRRITELTRELETPAAAMDVIEDYRERERALSQYFEATSPEAVVLSDVDETDLEESYGKLSEWRTVTRRLRELHEAKLRLESGTSTPPASSSP